MPEIARQHPSDELAHRESGLLLLISGPAGSGKTTICNGLLEDFPRLERVVTATTRDARGSERHGHDYHFLDHTDFLERVGQGHFLEYAEVHGNLYGTPADSVIPLLRKGRHLLLNIDVQGAASIRASTARDPILRDALETVFILPPSLAVIEERIQRRGRDPSAEIATRLETARRELGEANHFDYRLPGSTLEEDRRNAGAIYRAARMRRIHLGPIPSAIGN